MSARDIPCLRQNWLALKEGTFQAGQTAESRITREETDFSLTEMKFTFISILFFSVEGTVHPDKDRQYGSYDWQLFCPVNNLAPCRA